MGISTLQSYRGAQVFEAIGLSKSLVDKYFTGTSSRIEGVGLEVLAQEAHDEARSTRSRRRPSSIPNWRSAGIISIRVRGEYHLYNPLTVQKLQHAVRHGELRDLPGIHRPDRQAERDSCARCAG